MSNDTKIEELSTELSKLLQKNNKILNNVVQQAEQIKVKRLIFIKRQN
jgi:hypothetical protein